MMITLELPTDVEARFLAEAEAKGVSIDQIVKDYLVHLARTSREGTEQLTAEELDRAFEEAADLIPEGIPALSDEAMSRETIYTRE
jgi:hypothetical protein